MGDKVSYSDLRSNVNIILYSWIENRDMKYLLHSLETLSKLDID